jgi:hypothetical protein
MEQTHPDSSEGWWRSMRWMPPSRPRLPAGQLTYESVRELDAPESMFLLRKRRIVGFRRPCVRKSQPLKNGKILSSDD